MSFARGRFRYSAIQKNRQFFELSWTAKYANLLIKSVVLIVTADQWRAARLLTCQSKLQHLLYVFQFKNCTLHNFADRLILGMPDPVNGPRRVQSLCALITVHRSFGSCYSWARPKAGFSSFNDPRRHSRGTFVESIPDEERSKRRAADALLSFAWRRCSTVYCSTGMGVDIRK